MEQGGSKQERAPGSHPTNQEGPCMLLLLMDKILHDPKDPKLWELWYIPYNG